MLLRIVGGILALVGAAVLGMGIWGIAAANSMAQRLSRVAAQNGRGFDAEAVLCGALVGAAQSPPICRQGSSAAPGSPP
jgi:hypothetical protein